MSRLKKLAHTIYECKYHLVFCPKYRHRIIFTIKNPKRKLNCYFFSALFIPRYAPLLTPIDATSGITGCPPVTGGFPFGYPFKNITIWITRITNVQINIWVRGKSSVPLESRNISLKKLGLSSCCSFDVSVNSLHR